MAATTDTRRGRGTSDEKNASPLRRLVTRSNTRHAWEKARVRKPLAERKATGATEHDTGLKKQDLVFSAVYRETEACSHLAKIFGVSPGTALVERSYRTQHVDERHTLGIVRSYLVREDIAQNQELLDSRNEPWPGGTQSQLATVGIEFGKVTEHVTARSATPAEAVELGIGTSDPVLHIEKVAQDPTGRVVEVAHIALAGDRTRLEFTTPLDR
ncbi:UTRA domain-containing protein [Streptomyces sp. ID05-04B]|uniref:UTRA domain-containing protein n=1 Tax=Streptomyces sp. ID05-04B TaxID=3028661 RepID=UPI0029C39887|nr:UTRA domain-containing protein [Streptomyces sp. ID05-04B]MDX5563651.1 UTRA domain-containing protein [Streptomyces sp. ID05-04B]